MKNLITYLILIVFFNCSKSENTIDPPSKNNNLKSDFKLIGHRGGITGANPDNSLAALKGALTKEYDMAEIDIRFTSDGIPILHHEADLSDIYSNTSKPISSLTFQEIQTIKKNNGGLLPYSLEEFANASNGKIGFLLDIKGIGYPSTYYAKCIEILKNHGISNVKVAWSKEAKTNFYNKETIKIQLNYLDFSQIYTSSSFSADKYFLLVSAYEFNQSLIQKALDLNVEIVASVNEWSYRQRGITSTTIIKKDIDKLIDAGVRGFFIDSKYETLFNFK